MYEHPLTSMADQSNSIKTTGAITVYKGVVWINGMDSGNKRSTREVSQTRKFPDITVFAVDVHCI